MDRQEGLKNELNKIQSSIDQVQKSLEEVQDEAVKAELDKALDVLLQQKDNVLKLIK